MKPQMLQAIWNLVFWAGSWATSNTYCGFSDVEGRTRKSAHEQRKVTDTKEGRWSSLTYIWNNGILSGGKESAVSKNLQADKYKMSSLWGISPIKGPFPSATETFILLILLLFLQICKEILVTNSFTSAVVHLPMSIRRFFFHEMVKIAGPFIDTSRNSI